jgi:hypothetical protein
MTLGSGFQPFKLEPFLFCNILKMSFLESAFSRLSFQMMLLRDFNQPCLCWFVYLIILFSLCKLIDCGIKKPSLFHYGPSGI